MRKTVIILAVLAVLCGVIAVVCLNYPGVSRPAQMDAAASAAATETTAGTEPVFAAVQPETEPQETAPQEERFLLSFVGDCTLGANPSNYYAGVGFIKTVGEDYDYPFRNVLSYFEADDATFANLEGALTDTGNPMDKTHTFRGPTSYSEILTRNSVDVVTLANNHSYDYGQTGYDSTKETLEEAGIPYVERDSSRLVTLDCGLTVGLYGMVYYAFDLEDMKAEISDLRQQGAELVIVAPHWGNEGNYRPTQQQTEVGHAAIDAGADIVWGSHPHVLQPIEEYHNGIIYYSMGNFCFGGNGKPDDLDSVLLQQEVIRTPDGSVSLGKVKIIPCSISSVPEINNFQPTPMAVGGEDYNRVLSKLGGTFAGPNLKIHKIAK